jgi:hypothetical protein
LEEVVSDIADILEKAADLIEPEGAWLQGQYAKDDRGNFAAPEASYAVCWCAVGALQRASRLDLNGYFGAADTLADHVQSHVVVWNDAPERTQTEVVAKLREAAAKARAHD